MFGIGGVELIIILLFAFLIVGPDRLPEVAKTLGKAVAKFRSAQDQMNDVIKEQSAAIKSEVDASRKAREEAKAAAPKAEPKEEAVAEAPASEPVEASSDSAPAKTMSFSERKAAYEKERAAKEAEAAAAAQQKEGE